jgi:hypothetical protein
MVPRIRVIAISSLLLMLGFRVDASHPVAIFSFGEPNSFCGNWIEVSKDRERRDPYLHWIRGFISGYNVANPNRTVPLEAMPNQETLALYLDKFCREQPLKPLFFAALELAKEISQPVPTNKKK